MSRKGGFAHRSLCQRLRGANVARRLVPMRVFWSHRASAILLLALLFPISALAAETGNAFLAPAQDRQLIETALRKEQPVEAPPAGATGITVPHHLLAPDLIARGVWTSSSSHYDWILLLSPDHFGSHATPFGVTTIELGSIMGRSGPVRRIADDLLQVPDKVTDTGTAGAEHGVHAVIPFLHAIHSGKPIIAITTGDSAEPDDWRWMAQRLTALLNQHGDERVLVVQSTDYSHHLPVAVAAQRDQETLAAIARGTPEAVLQLIQPAHLDSSGSQYIQAYLQHNLFASAPVILANRSSHEYAGDGRDTTSYVVTAWFQNGTAGARLEYNDQLKFYFAGDFFAGRGVTPFLRSPKARRHIVERIRQVTNGGKLIVNLEGALLPEIPANASPVQHVMEEALAGPILQELNVIGTSLANNHAYDYGEDGYVLSQDALERLKIRPLHHGTIAEFDGFGILPLTFKRGMTTGHDAIRDVSELEWICNTASVSPLIAFVHWGEEYTRAPAAFESEAAQKLADCGVSAIIGSHSHQAARRVGMLSGGTSQIVFSLGNLLFDQPGGRADSAILEVRVFRQGTLALRLIPFPNLFEELQRDLTMDDAGPL